MGTSRSALYAPCARCPFRTDIPPYLTRERAAEISEAMTVRDEPFWCHATVDYDADPDYGEDDDRDTISPAAIARASHCAGAAIILVREGRMNQWLRIMARIRAFDPSKLAMHAPIFDTLRDWIRAQPTR